MKNFMYIDLDRDMYTKPNRTFSEILLEKDPDIDHIDTIYEGTTAFERQLIRYGIKVKDGKLPAGIVNDFYKSRGSSILFPEYIRRCVQKGMDRNPILKTVIATDNYFYQGDDVSGMCLDKDIILNRYGNRLDMLLFDNFRNLKINILSNILENVGEAIADRLVSCMVGFLKCANFKEMPFNEFFKYYPLSFRNSTSNACYVLNSETLRSIDISLEIQWITNCFGKTKTACIIVNDCVDNNEILMFDTHHQLGMLHSKELIISDLDSIISGDLSTIYAGYIVGFYNICGDIFKIII